MTNYIVLSLETHLFFARIMKEHALFLMAGFPCKNQSYIEKADWFRIEFESLLQDVVYFSNGRISRGIVESDELVTSFTIPTEERTACLSGIPIDTELSQQEHNLNYGCMRGESRELYQKVYWINERAFKLLNGLIEFKEDLLKNVCSGNLFTSNYPLLIEHILREARLYRDTVRELMQNRKVSYQCLYRKEEFWNRIMMEHALFIRGLLDPSEEQLIHTADDFASEYRELLELAKLQDCRAMENLTKKSLKETLKYRDFKAAGTEGILNCKISSIILPLLADHVLREANHYIRLLNNESVQRRNNNGIM